MMDIITKIVLPILTALLSGGALLTILTAKAKKDEATANTDKVEMDNFRTGTELLMKNIVEPLKAELAETRKDQAETRKELDETRRELRSMEYQVKMLRKALERINDCEHAGNCPVRAAIKDTDGKE